MSAELIVAIGAALIALVVGIGVLVDSWPRPDTRKSPERLYGERLRDQLDRELRAQQRISGEVIARMRDEGDALASGLRVGDEFDHPTHGRLRVERIFGGADDEHCSPVDGCDCRRCELLREMDGE